MEIIKNPAQIILTTCTILCLFFINHPLSAKQPIPTMLPQDARLSMVGDSITAFKKYSPFVETYILVCAGRPDVQAFQFGVGGDTALGFNRRIESNLILFQPTVMTICFGMNDGSYAPINEKIGERYAENLHNVIEKAKENGVKSIFLASPGCVDIDFFRPGKTFKDGLKASESYNKTLKYLRDTAESVAKTKNVSFVDIHTPLYKTMTEAKSALGHDYAVCGAGDGIHPDVNGGLVMAFAILRALGFTGDIGMIEVDMKGKSSATAGHEIIKSDEGKLELKSVRYPFCFSDDKKKGTRSILPFLPFNQDLNRFILKVKNLNSSKAKVTWGTETHEFSADQLQKGINLAAEFKKTPFDKPFDDVLTAVTKKEAFEVDLIRDYGGYPGWLIETFKDSPKASQAVKTLNKTFMSHWDELNNAVRKAYQPVTCKLIIKPIKN